MVNKRIIIIFILIFFIFNIKIIFAKDNISEKIEVTGVSYINKGNLSKAYKAAINDALRRGVEEVVGFYINAETKTKNYQLISDNILKSSQGYVKSYRVLEKKIEDGNYYVKLEVEIGTGDLSKDLEALRLAIKARNNPRVIFLIDQEVEYVYSSNKIVENELIKKFIDYGYQVVDAGEVEQLITRQRKNAILNGDILLSAKFANKLKADLIVVGKAFASYINLSRQLDDDLLDDLVSYHSQLELRVIQSSNANVVALANGSGKGIDTAKERAANKALLAVSKDVSSKLVKQLSKELVKGNKSLNLQIGGINSLKLLAKLKNSLPLLSGVEKVYFREYTEGLAIFDLDLDNRTEVLDLAIELEEIITVNFKISNLTDGQLSLEVEN